MSAAPHGLAETYAAALRSLAAQSGDETSLEAAYRLGRQALEDGVGLIDIAMIHHATVAELIAGTGPDQARARLDQAAAFFAECVAPFEMQLLGVSDANRRLMALNADLDRLVAERTAQLEAANEHQARLHEHLQQSYDELRRTQESAMQQERLRVIGQMASGIAHDINNAISPVAIYTQTLLETGAAMSPPLRAYLKTVGRVIDDVAATAGRMRDLYRQRESDAPLLPLDLNELAQQVVDLTRARWSDLPQLRGVVIRVETRLAAPLPPVCADGTGIREALINLVFNAVDAMPDGGTLFVRTGTEAAADGGERVFVAVSDTGVGMDEETCRRCREPFFTTKGERGTGLGLAMVAAIAQRHEAEVAIDSTPGAGTTVRLAFAAAHGAHPGGAEPGAPVGVRPSRILLIDDSPAILDAMRIFLELDGHTSVAAEGGRAGIEAFQAAHDRGEPFALVITDLGMPEVDGNQVAKAIKTLAPGTPVIMLTGWGRRLHADAEATAYVDRLLDKPPSIDDLREALLSLLPKG